MNKKKTILLIIYAFLVSMILLSFVFTSKLFSMISFWLDTTNISKIMIKITYNIITLLCLNTITTLYLSLFYNDFYDNAIKRELSLAPHFKYYIDNSYSYSTN